MKVCTRFLDARGAETTALEEALDVLHEGGLVVFPTDTVYGVGCDLWSEESIARLYWAKQRSFHLPIPVLISGPAHVVQVARCTPASYAALAQRYWPGGLTLVLWRRPEVPASLCSGGDTIAVRMPDQPLALRLIEAMGGALAVTSANLSGNSAPADAAGALSELGGRVEIVLNGGDCPGGVASTIVDLTSDPPTLLRAGPLSVEELSQVVPGLKG